MKDFKIKVLSPAAEFIQNLPQEEQDLILDTLNKLKKGEAEIHAVEGEEGLFYIDVPKFKKGKKKG